MAIQVYNLYYELDGQQLPTNGLAGIAGSSDVEDAYGSFVGNWSDGLFYAREHLSKLADNLSTAADMYGHTDHTIQQAAAPQPGR